MLWCATPAAVWEQDIAVFSMYFREQHHDSLADYLHYKMVEEQQHNIHTQVTLCYVFHIDQYIFLYIWWYNSHPLIRPPFLPWQRDLKKGVASLEGDNWVVFYYLSAYEICPDKRDVAFNARELIRGGQL